MDIIWIFLPAILWLGIITSYHDIREGRIKNTHIITALIYAITAYLLLTLFFYFTGIGVRHSYFYDILVNIFIASILSYLLWHIKFWSAADGKLFVAYTALIPLTEYSASYYRFFPAFVVLINTFVPFFIYSLFILAFVARKNKRVKMLKAGFSKDFLVVILTLFWMMWIPKLLNMLFNINIDFITGFALLISLMGIAKKLSKGKILYLSIVLCLCRIVFDYKYITTMYFIKQFVLFSFVAFVVFLAIKLSLSVFVKAVNLNELKRGMILAEQVYKEKKDKKYKRGGFPSGKTVEFLIFEHPAEGLTDKDVERIKRLYEKRKLAFSEIEIQQTVPFAPIIFIGVIITIIAKGNFPILIAKFL